LKQWRVGGPLELRFEGSGTDHEVVEAVAKPAQDRVGDELAGDLVAPLLNEVAQEVEVHFRAISEAMAAQLIVFSNAVDDRAVLRRADVSSRTDDRMQTDRLDLVACSLGAARASLRSPKELERLLGAAVPNSWPPAELVDALSYYARQLAGDRGQLGWGIWLIFGRGERSLVGSAGFKGPPDARGYVEVGYGIEAPFRRLGYATEAVGALLEWGWAHGVKAVIAECHVDNAASIRVLEKLGMVRTKPRGEMLWWEIRTPA
jgi:ribosomal-protein-alanine N-acetyltransferase